MFETRPSQKTYATLHAKCAELCDVMEQIALAKKEREWRDPKSDWRGRHRILVAEPLPPLYWEVKRLLRLFAGDADICQHARHLPGRFNLWTRSACFVVICVFILFVACFSDVLLFDAGAVPLFDTEAWHLLRRFRSYYWFPLILVLAPMIIYGIRSFGASGYNRIERHVREIGAIASQKAHG